MNRTLPLLFLVVIPLFVVVIQSFLDKPNITWMQFIDSQNKGLENNILKRGVIN